MKVAPAADGHRPHLPALLGGGGLVIAVIVLLTGWAIIQGKADARRVAEITTANLSQTLADNFNSAVGQIDLSMLAILDEVGRQQRAGGWDDAAISVTLGRMDQRNPNSLGFRIYNADGTFRAGVSNVGNRSGDISTRADFVRMRDDPSTGLLASPPLFGSVVRQWVVAFGRRIPNPDGSFGGVIYGSIPLAAIEKEFSRVDMGPGGTVALYHDSFRLAARIPKAKGQDDLLGTVAISDALRAIIASKAENAHYEYRSVVDGVCRLAHVRRIPGQPYYILVGQSEDYYLADWRHHRDQFLAFAGLMVALVLVAMVIIHRRIVVWRHVTESLAEKTKLLGQSNADLEQFAYVASHDLRTPLRNIVSYAQLLERRYKGNFDADADDFIGFIVDSGKRMTELITDLLAYSRVANPSQPLQSLSANEAVAEALANLTLDIQETQAEITVGTLPKVAAEHSQLVSLFQNLIGNALKYRAPDRKAQISVTAEWIGGDRWRFAVSDNGIGIEPQYFDKVFEIFQRLYPAGDAEGTGIGLTLCRRIVNRFGGTIWVESRPGEGTTMLFTLRDGGSALPGE